MRNFKPQPWERKTEKPNYDEERRDCESKANRRFQIMFCDILNPIFRDYVKKPLTRSFYVRLDEPLTREEVERRIAEVFGH